MILVTVGTQLPFERLIQSIDNMAHLLDEPIFAQIGNSSYIPKNFESRATIEPVEFESKFKQASRIVSHAGIGTVLTAKRYMKPIILFPRRASAGEHRNDHQLATCERLEGRPGIFVAYDTQSLHEFISMPLPTAIAEDEFASDTEHQQLIRGIAEFIRTR